jgi:hypothetical protein
MGVITWLKRQGSYMALAMGGVEKNIFSQKGGDLSSDIIQERRHTQGTLMDSLKHGEVTQEVLNLKWRTYKILRATEGYRSDIVGYTKDGTPITKTIKIDSKLALKGILLDKHDNYPLEMVVDNSEISLGTSDVLNNEHIKSLEQAEIEYDDKGEAISASHGEISRTEYFTSNKGERPIEIIREIPSNFRIETFTKKLHIRRIDDKNVLLEFYVSKYPDEYNRTSRLFISEIKKIMGNSLFKSTSLEIKKVNLVTYKTIGANDFLEYQYGIISFDKIIDFNGHYVIKFIAEVNVNGKDILEKHRMVKLDEKYKNKEKKNNNINYGNW